MRPWIPILLFTASCPSISSRAESPGLAHCFSGFGRLSAEIHPAATLQKLGFQLKGRTPWGTPIIDATTFPQGGSGPVRLHVSRAARAETDGLQIGFTTAYDQETALGTVVYLKEAHDGKIVFVAVPPGHETVDPRVSRFADRLLGKRLQE